MELNPQEIEPALKKIAENHDFFLSFSVNPLTSLFMIRFWRFECLGGGKKGPENDLDTF